MPVCSFCKESYDFPRGTTVVQRDGNIKFFCSSKCRKNAALGRDNKKVKWVRKSLISKEEKKKKDELKEVLLKEKQEALAVKKLKQEAKKKNKDEKKGVKKSVKNKEKSE